MLVLLTSRKWRVEEASQASKIIVKRRANTTGFLSLQRERSPLAFDSEQVINPPLRDRRGEREREREEARKA
jgi:hypothetical protein